MARQTCSYMSAHRRGGWHDHPPRGPAHTVRSRQRSPKRKNKRPKSQGRLVAEHKFQAGQRVTLAANIINRSAAGGGYVVTKQLPERDGEFEYRIKSASGTQERVARENELARE
jgi:hypothetical protein